MRSLFHFQQQVGDKMTTVKNGKFDELLAMEVASGSTIKAASKTVGCALQTAYNISSDPSFATRVASIRSEVLSQSVGKLSNAASQAVDTLVSLLGQANEPAIRLNSAKAILAQLGPLTELGELRARIDRIEGAKLRVVG